MTLRISSENQAGAFARLSLSGCVLSCALIAAACSSEDNGTTTGGSTSEGGARAAATSGSGASSTVSAGRASAEGGRSAPSTGGSVAVAGRTAASAGKGGSGGTAAGSGGSAAGEGGATSVGEGGDAPTVAGQGGESAAAGAGGAAGASGGGAIEGDDDAGVEDPGDPETPPTGDPGRGDGRNVVTLGDSWMEFSANVGIEDSLRAASGQPYRTYGMDGAQFLTNQIDAQYDVAHAEDPDIKTVILTAGGDDIFRADRQQGCLEGAPECADTLLEVRKRINLLLLQLSQDGVEDAVIVPFNKNAGGGIPAYDEHLQAVTQLCAAAPAPLRCQIFAIEDALMGDLRLDGVHPSDAAFNRIGNAVFALMVAQQMHR
jgi:hypothetical protein